MKLNKLSGNTYYIDGITNIGLYVLNDNNDVCLIDTGISSNGPKIYKILKDNNFNLKYIINTHVHADHIGANKYLMNMTKASMITSKIERAFAYDNKLDIGFLYGGYPLAKFETPLMHISSHKNILHLSRLPKGITYFSLPGHHYNMVGFKTSDNVYFVADAIGNKETIMSEHILLIYDVQGYIDSLNKIKEFDGNFIVPSHSKVTKNISDLCNFNLANIEKIKDVVLNIVQTPQKLDDIIKKVFDYYDIRISYNKYLLISSTVRSFLSYLFNLNLIDTKFENNYLLYFRKG